MRAALGIAEWNVYGVSYGTRVAQHYLRRFPEHARAVVLDGVVPPALALGPDVAREAQRALDANLRALPRRRRLRQSVSRTCPRSSRRCSRGSRPRPWARRARQARTRRRRRSRPRASAAREDHVRRARAARARAVHELQRRDGRAAAGAAARGVQGQLRPAREPGEHAAARLARVVELRDEQLRRLHGRHAVRRRRRGRRRSPTLISARRSSIR